MRSIARIELRSRDGGPERYARLQCGVPLERGVASDQHEFSLFDARDVRLDEAICRPVLYWPDRSVRWLHVDCVCEVQPEASETLLVRAAERIEGSAASHVRQSTSTTTLELRTEHVCCTVDRASGRLFCRHDGPHCGPGLGFSARIEIADAEGWRSPLDIRHVSHEHRDRDRRSVDVVIDGAVALADGRPLNVKTCIRLHVARRWIELDVKLHNPAAAVHPGGRWDLGDPGSAMISAVNLVFEDLDGDSISVVPNSGADPISGDRVVVYQESSGGPNFRSSIHRNRRAHVPHRLEGFVVERDGTLTAYGRRAAPVVHVRRRNRSVGFEPERFWQTFPRALDARPDSISYQLLPDRYPDLHELQAGERHSSRLFVLFDRDRLPRSAPGPTFDVRIVSKALRSDPLTYLATLGMKDPLGELVAGAHDERHGFVSKRERIDGYGWRHYGDLLADHESHYLPRDSAPFVSHYNNQYDAVLGFGLAFLRDGDSRWFGLMDDLARHLVDIDIYHTDDDRAEYNHGLFWHTDHYLDAGLSSHRTFSRLQRGTDRDHGGGPGPQHAYGTGLLLHHAITGNETSAEGLLALATWLRNWYEAETCSLACLARMRERVSNRLAHRPTGAWHRFPITRDTGNYLSILLDTFQLTGDRIWLQRAEAVIRDTVHPDDRVDARGLLDVERQWSYTVTLLALAKYVVVKACFDERDAMAAYASRTLLSYTDWMVRHERPYLSAPDTLEYPNHTWSAQEIRKINLLCIAASIAPDDPVPRLSKAREWLEALREALRDSDERYYTRILVILLQNQGTSQVLESTGHPFDRLRDMHRCENELPATACNGPWPFVRACMRELLATVRAFSPSSERQWIVFRRRSRT